MKPDPHDWTSWLTANPPPDLQTLVAHWGGYDRVPEAAWEEHTTALERWETARLTHLFGSRSWTMTQDRKRKGPPGAQGSPRMRQKGGKAPG